MREGESERERALPPPPPEQVLARLEGLCAAPLAEAAGEGE